MGSDNGIHFLNFKYWFEGCVKCISTHLGHSLLGHRRARVFRVVDDRLDRDDCKHLSLFVEGDTLDGRVESDQRPLGVGSCKMSRHINMAGTSITGSTYIRRDRKKINRLYNGYTECSSIATDGQCNGLSDSVQLLIFWHSTAHLVPFVCASRDVIHENRAGRVRGDVTAEVLLERVVRELKALL